MNVVTIGTQLTDVASLNIYECSNYWDTINKKRTPLSYVRTQRNTKFHFNAKMFKARTMILFIIASGQG